MADKILTGKDLAVLHGKKDARGFMVDVARINGVKIELRETIKFPLQARINYGRWICDCECGGHEMVDPTDPVFFCQSCGNSSVDGRLRKVIFPKDREEIEQVLLERAVDDRLIKNMNAMVRAVRGKLTDNVPRSWVPGESVNDLRRQHKNGKQTVEGLKDGIH